MDHFLNSARTSGRHDSEGGFTLSLERSAWKLAQYRLANPGDYPLHVLACAVASGASTFELTTDFDSTHIRFNGRPFGENDFRVLANSLSQKNMPARLRSLEVALSAAASHSTVRFGVRSAGFFKELRMIAGEAVMADLPEETGRETTFNVDQGLGPKDVLNFQTLARYAPLTLRVNGHIVKPKRDDAFQPTGVLSVEGQERIQKFKCRRSKTMFVKSLPSRSGSAYLFLLEPGVGVEEPLVYLSNGVVVQSEPSFSPFPMLRGYVTCNHLKMDISHKSLRRDKAYDAFESWLDQLVETFLLAFCDSPPRLRRSFLKEFHLWLKLRYKDREMPKEVALFLESTSDLEATTSVDELTKIGAEALRSGSYITVERMRTQQAGEVTAAWFAGDWVQVKAWAQAQRALSVAIREPTDNCDAMLCLIQFLGQSKMPHRRAKALLNSPELPPALRYRALLVLAAGMDAEDLLQALEELDVAELWKRPFRVLCFDEWIKADDVWTLIRHIRDGDFEQALNLVNGTQDEDIRAQMAPWLELVSRLAPGHCSWYTQIKLRARCSMAWIGRSESDEFNRLMKDALVAEPWDPPNSYWMWTRGTSAMACVLARQLQHHKLSRTRAKILARTLLLNSFDPNTGYTADSQLPAQIFRG